MKLRKVLSLTLAIIVTCAVSCGCKDNSSGIVSTGSEIKLSSEERAGNYIVSKDEFYSKAAEIVDLANYKELVVTSDSLFLDIAEEKNAGKNFEPTIVFKECGSLSLGMTLGDALKAGWSCEENLKSVKIGALETQMFYLTNKNNESVAVYAKNDGKRPVSSVNGIIYMMDIDLRLLYTGKTENLDDVPVFMLGDGVNNNSTISDACEKFGDPVGIIYLISENYSDEVLVKFENESCNIDIVFSAMHNLITDVTVY